MVKKMDLLAYCGLYCGSCPAYTQSIANLAGGLQKELRRSKCDKAAPALAKIPAFSAFKHYQKFCELLGTMMKMRCKKSCRTGGGSAQCRIKKCAIKKGYDGCLPENCDSPRRIDADCPVRPCVMAKDLPNCAHCDEYICDKLAKRIVEPKKVLSKCKKPPSQQDYDRFIKPYDNKTRLDKIREQLGK